MAFAVAGLTAAYLGPERTVVSSFDVGTIAAVKAADPEIPTALVCGIIDPASAVARALAHGMAALHPYDAMCTPAFVSKAHSAGLDVFAWTVNDPDRMTNLTAMGIDGIITDHPDIARTVVDRVA